MKSCFNRLWRVLLVAMSMTVVWIASASAQCVGNTCSLGGQLRQQIGNGLPLPLTLEPAISGPVAWGQPGGIQAKPGATIMQQDPAPPGTPGSAPRSLMLPPAQLTYDGPPVSLGLVHANPKVFAIQTNLDVVAPHPGTTASGGPASGGPFGSATFVAGGRTGPTVVSWCAGLAPPTASFNPGCPSPDNFGFVTTTTGGAVTSRPPTNGLIRYTATRNQFGGAMRSRTLGTKRVFYNAGGLGVNDLPCNHTTNPLCLVAISSAAPNSQGVFGARFGVTGSQSAFMRSDGVRTASVGANGTILGTGPFAPPFPFTGQILKSWGIPYSTGRLTISVTRQYDAFAPYVYSTFTRTGADHRTNGGEGIVVLVGGGLSSRSISGPTGDRSWLTLNVPEPSTALAFSFSAIGLLICHRVARRRNRR